MKRKLLVLACLLASFALMTAVIAAQEAEPEQPDQADTDVDTGMEADLGLVFLDEVGGFDGMAILHGNGHGGTEVSMGLRAAGGFLGIGRGDPERLGQAAILFGTCSEPDSIVEEIGELMPVRLPGQQENDEPEGYALVGSIGLGLDELRAAEYVLGVLEREDRVDDQNGQQDGTVQDGQQQNGVDNQTGQQQNGVFQQEDRISLAACGTIGQAGTEPGFLEPGAESTPTPQDMTPGPNLQ